MAFFTFTLLDLWHGFQLAPGGRQLQHVDVTRGQIMIQTRDRYILDPVQEAANGKYIMIVSMDTAHGLGCIVWSPRGLIETLGVSVILSALDCWSTSRAIDPAPGAWLITKFISLVQVIPGPV